MKVNAFFKILNKKIEQYDKVVSNPFSLPRSFILIWTDEETSDEDKNSKSTD